MEDGEFPINVLFYHFFLVDIIFILVSRITFWTTVITVLSASTSGSIVVDIDGIARVFTAS